MNKVEPFYDFHGCEHILGSEAEDELKALSETEMPSVVVIGDVDDKVMDLIRDRLDGKFNVVTLDSIPSPELKEAEPCIKVGHGVTGNPLYDGEARISLSGLTARALSDAMATEPFDYKPLGRWAETERSKYKPQSQHGYQPYVRRGKGRKRNRF